MQRYYLLCATDKGLAFDGGAPFDYPFPQWLDGDHRSAFFRRFEKSAFNGQTEAIKFAKAPDPDPYDLDLCRGVNLCEMIWDASEGIIALSEPFYSKAPDAFEASLEALHTIHTFRYPGKRGGNVKPKPYRVGTLGPRDLIATHVDFAGSHFARVDSMDFSRHGTRAMRGEIELGAAYESLENNLTFADFDEFFEASGAAITRLERHIPTQLALNLPVAPAIFQLKGTLVLVNDAIAKLLSSAKNPGCLCPYPAIRVMLSKPHALTSY